jgi:hypothetical protein
MVVAKLFQLFQPIGGVVASTFGAPFARTGCAKAARAAPPASNPLRVVILSALCNYLSEYLTGHEENASENFLTSSPACDKPSAMNILLIGSGGREHALAWKIKQSPLVERLAIAPGNPGMAALGECHDVKVTDVPALVELAREVAADLVVVGPESALAAGLADALAAVKIPCFGPAQKAAQLESSKAFTKDFCKRHNIPTAASQTFFGRRGARVPEILQPALCHQG